MFYLLCCRKKIRFLVRMFLIARNVILPCNRVVFSTKYISWDKKIFYSMTSSGILTCLPHHRCKSFTEKFGILPYFDTLKICVKIFMKTVQIFQWFRSVYSELTGMIIDEAKSQVLLSLIVPHRVSYITTTTRYHSSLFCCLLFLCAIVILLTTSFSF